MEHYICERNYEVESKVKVKLEVVTDANELSLSGVNKEALWLNEKAEKQITSLLYLNNQTKEEKLDQQRYREEMYAGHVVKEELVLGPEELQEPDVAMTSDNLEAGACSTNRNNACVEVPLGESIVCVSGSSPFYCPVCNMDCQERSKMIEHLQTHFSEKLKSNSDLNPHSKTILDTYNNSGEKLFSCSICQKKFRKRKRLNEHSLVHSNNKPHNCDTCGKKYKKRKVLNEHIKRVHTKDCPYNCDICGKGVLFIGELRKHMQSHANGEPWRKKIFDKHLNIAHNCDICGKKFKFYCRLKKHTTRAHTKDYTLKCSICGKGFMYNSYLQVHLQTHKKTFSCSFCKRKFEDKAALIKHLVVHTKETPSCDICGKKFKYNRILNVHTKRVHRERPLKCNICGKGFLYNYELKTHMLRKNHSAAQIAKSNV